MIILYPDRGEDYKNTPLVIVIFGLGLLGSASYRSIVAQAGSLKRHVCDFDWQSGYQQEENARQIQQQLIEICESLGNPGRLIFLWSAGRAGFASNNEEVEKELASYNVVLDMARHLQASLRAVPVEFHLLSSAGGLFERSTYIKQTTLPAPSRPYGFLKQEQEQLLLKEQSLVPQIYRPSTVYGPISAGIRRGLVSTLLHNGSLRIVSDIFGQLSTLRDYVYYKDIADFIAANILQEHAESRNTIHHLISGKPSSIYETIHIIERILRHPIYYKLQYDPENSCDMSFSPSLYPHGWQPTDLYVGCEQIHRKWRFTGVRRTF